VFWVDEAKLQKELAEPPDERVTFAGLHETLKPLEGVADSARLTMPEKFPRLVRLMVDETLEPTGKVTVGGFAAILKSDDAITLVLMLAEWDSEPLVPVAVTL